MFITDSLWLDIFLISWVLACALIYIKSKKVIYIVGGGFLAACTSVVIGIGIKETIPLLSQLNDDVMLYVPFLVFVISLVADIVSFKRSFIHAFFNSAFLAAIMFLCLTFIF